jgi:two-component system cell cycle sensor histidine kinase/response regulator CckA
MHHESTEGPFASKPAETILLVEDDDCLRILVHRVLDRLGYQVLVARDGREALARCQSHAGALHLVLSDVVMPELSGMEVAKHVQGRFADAKSLFMSGHLSHALLEDGVLRNGAHFIQKPFLPEALARKVREVLDGSPSRTVVTGRRRT